jgi:hypothetical protein
MKYSFYLLPACLLIVYIVLLLIQQINKEALYYRIMYYFLISLELYLSIIGVLCSTVYNLDCNAQYIACVCVIFLCI